MYLTKDKHYENIVSILQSYEKLDFIPLKVVRKEYGFRFTKINNYIYEPLLKQMQISDNFLLGVELNDNLTGLLLKLIDGHTFDYEVIKDIKFLGKTIVRGKLGSIKYLAFDTKSLLTDNPKYSIVNPLDYYKACRKVRNDI